ncbi:MAG: fused MFS/spermidine synthase [Polyangiaceae bacterium]
MIAEVRGQAATLVVRDRAGQREMVAQDAEGEMVWTRVALDDPARSGWPYVDLLHLAATRARRRRRALFVGLGGGVAMRQFARTYPGIRLDVVERDPMVVALARAHFRLDDIPQLRVVVEDGARFVRRAPAAHWDVVVVDAYDAGRPAADMAQRPFFAALHRATRPGGAVAINLVSALDAPSLGQLVHRLSRRFDDVRLAPVVVANERYRADARRNVVVTAVRR